MDCWQCSTELIWGGDHEFEDYAIDGNGVVTNLSCPKCDSTVLVYTPIGGPPPEVNPENGDEWSRGYQIGYNQMKNFYAKTITELEADRDRWKEMAMR